MSAWTQIPYIKLHDGIVLPELVAILSRKGVGIHTTMGSKSEAKEASKIQARVRHHDARFWLGLIGCSDGSAMIGWLCMQYDSKEKIYFRKHIECQVAMDLTIKKYMDANRMMV